MEWLDGVGLDELLRQRGWFTVAETLCYAEQICAALRAVHDQGVIHRDLKPENVLVLHSHPLTLKVVDFGVAKRLSPASAEVELTTAGELVGTPMNMAPEQIEGRRREIGPWTDVYALGLLLYTMLAGSHPYDGVNLEAAIFRNLLDPPQPLFRVTPDVPEEVSDVVQCCLEKDPVQRYPSVTELLAALTAAVEAASPPHLTDETVQDAVPLHLADETEETEETDLDPDQLQTAVYPSAGPARVPDTVPDTPLSTLLGSDRVGFSSEVGGAIGDPGPGELTVSGEIISPGLEFEVAEQLPPPSHGEPPTLQQEPTPVVVERGSWSGLPWLLLGVGLMVVAVGLFLILAFL
jgi:serine/threonine protein kinase